MVIKELLLKELAEFTWDFGSKFFVETKYGNFVWSDPDYNGDNTMTEFPGEVWEFFGPDGFGRAKGTHLVSRYCGDQFIMRRKNA